MNENPPTSSVPNTENWSKKPHVEMNDINLDTIERDPGLLIQIYDYPYNQRDTVRRAYMNLGPLQTKLSEYPKIWTRNS